MAAFGDTLRHARALKGVTLKEAERATRINRHHLAALEEENFSALPPLIYQRGIVRHYANYLKLDANKVLLMFEEAIGAPDEPQVGMVVKPLDMPSHWAPNFAIIAFMVVMSAIVFAWLYSAYFAPAEAVSTPTELIATVTPVDSDALIIPSPTPRPATPTAAPTATPSPTPEPKPTKEPTAAATVAEEAETMAADEETETIVEDAEVIEPEPPHVDEAADSVIAIQITASAEIYIEVVADGTPVFAGTLASGESTEWFRASQLQVSTTDGSNTIFTNGNGETFWMGYGANEIYNLP